MTRMTARAARALDKIPYASNRRGKWENKWEDKWEHKWEHTWEHRWEDKDKWETWDRWKRAPSGTDDNTAVTRVVAAPLSARLCAHIVRGARCPLGAACPFAHTAAELPDKYKTTACNKWARRAGASRECGARVRGASVRRAFLPFAFVFASCAHAVRSRRFPFCSSALLLFSVLLRRTVPVCSRRV